MHGQRACMGFSLRDKHCCSRLAHSAASAPGGLGPPEGLTHTGRSRAKAPAMHGPNVDAVRWLRQDIWKVVRERGGEMELRVYGAHFDTKASLAQMHNQGEGFLVEGFASDLRDVLSKARVLVAPLRYGAGE